ncbi:MAG: diaminopimelate epimerase [Actinomycetota bacterium]|nr:diaminopimelate epimerase [Actinomycetota bacterium]
MGDLHVDVDVEAMPGDLGSRVDPDVPTVRSFAKYHGTGNDFVMVEDPDDHIRLSPQLIAALCDRHFGVGADGLIRVTAGRGAARAGLDDQAGRADFFMDYHNADGGPAEMCGNGIRCLGKLAYERGLTKKAELDVATRGGLKHIVLDVHEGEVRSVTVDMGPPAFSLQEIPMAGSPEDTFLGQPFEWEGGAFTASAVSMGNPHLVLFVDRDPRGLDVARIGPVLEHDPRFPNRTNVEFVAPTPDGIRVRVWERGVGETMACGTGACASLVASHLAGITARRGKVHFPGGAVEVEWLPDGPVIMTGPAVRVYEGQVEVDGLLAAWSAAREASS